MGLDRLSNPWGWCSKLAPRASLLLRVEPLGAKPKASLDGLPGFATQLIARKTAPPKGFGQKRALCSSNRLRVPTGTRRAMLAIKSSRFWTRTRMAGVLNNIPGCSLLFLDEPRVPTYIANLLSK
jgi:hypothetical protein